MNFKKGDCIIINDIERPCPGLVAVITSKRKGVYFVKYLNADPKLSSYNRPAMKCALRDATLLSDFGVRLLIDAMHYWVEIVGYSTARYRDGVIRKWDDPCPGRKYAYRPDVARSLGTGDGSSSSAGVVANP